MFRKLIEVVQLLKPTLIFLLFVLLASRQDRAQIEIAISVLCPLDRLN